MRCDLVPKLDAHLDAFRETPFAYGQSDCLIFTLSWVKAATGTDHLAGVSYGSLESALAALAARGFADWTEALDSILERKPKAQARLGDIVAHKQDSALGICLGARCAFLGPVKGIRLHSLDGCTIAWSVEPCPS